MTVCEAHVRRRLALAAAGMALALGVDAASAPPVPAALTALLSAQGIDRPVVAWCKAEFRAGRPDGFAVALQSATGGGTYAVIEAQTPIAELGTYLEQPSIDCYSRAEADNLARTLRRSATVHGDVIPRWKTAVVCAFGDQTSATCWQYSPVGRAFVAVGRWIT